MKSFLTRSLFALALSMTLAATTFAGETKKSVTFSSDVNINGTIVKKGTYKAVYNDQTNEVAILEGKKEVAKVGVQTKARDKKAGRTEVLYTMNGDSRNLQGIAFEGENQTLMVNGSQAANPNQ